MAWRAVQALRRSGIRQQWGVFAGAPCSAICINPGVGTSAHNQSPHRSPGAKDVASVLGLRPSEHRCSSAARSCHANRRRARVPAAQMMEDLIDDILLRDERDDAHRSGTVGHLSGSTSRSVFILHLVQRICALMFSSGDREVFRSEASRAILRDRCRCVP